MLCITPVDQRETENVWNVTGRWRLAIALVLGFAIAHAAVARAEDSTAPSFLPGYYLPQMMIAGEMPRLTEHTEKDRIDRYVYTTQDEVVTEAIENLRCDSATCATVYDNAAKYLDQQASGNGGRFLTVTPTEFRVAWQTGLGDNTTFVFRLSSSILFWTYSTRLDRKLDLDARFTALRMLANRQRYEQAIQAGNVDLGRWDPQLRDYARALIHDGHQGAALAVLRAILATTPQDYEAQLMFATVTDDRQAARASAQAVYDNAESADLTGRAADLLGRSEPGFESTPALADGEHGLQVVFIALPPCDTRLLNDAASVFRRIVDLPVKVVRLAEPWQWGPPDRIADQRAIQQTIIQQQGPNIDFRGWTEARYREALMRVVTGKDALSRYSMESYVNKLPGRPGQYDVDPYVSRLIDILAQHRANDRRTMFVGVTALNIYSGDSNFVFSSWTAHGDAGASILSYAMMTAKTLNEPYESRRRLAERLAKEMVPASLKSLGIPRPVDPTDPYSYSNGVGRLAEKSLELSAPTKAALDKFR